MALSLPDLPAVAALPRGLVGGALGFQFQLGRGLVIVDGIQLCQTMHHRVGKANIGDGHHSGSAASAAAAQFSLRKRDTEPDALADLGKVADAAHGVVRCIGGQQQHAGISGPGHGLHRLLADCQMVAAQAQAQQGENVLFIVHWFLPVLPPWHHRPPG